MYTQFFKLTHSPFSIAPDPRFLFMSERHREALAHLLYGVDVGGFVLLTGEIGAGKTTVCRCFLEQIPENCQVGYIFNPKLTVTELLQSICDEFGINAGRRDRIDAASADSNKIYVDALNVFLLDAHAAAKNCVLIIDEAQSLSADVLEQLRLLTNLETSERKLLQIILIGQPELRTLLDKPALQQLAQRIIARYHLDALPADDTARYVLHRLSIAGGVTAAPLSPFPPALMKSIHRLTQGVPRRINLLCDRALLGAYAEGKLSVNRRILRKAAREVFGDGARKPWPAKPLTYAALGWAGGIVLAGATAFAIASHTGKSTPSPTWTTALAHTASSPIATTAAPVNLDNIPAGADNPAAALGDLARRWGQTASPNEVTCDGLMAVNLRCYRSGKGFAEIRQLNRPVLLSLHDQVDRPYYAVLSEIGDTQASLTFGDTRHTNYRVSLTDLMRHFHGEFTTLWRIPANFRNQLRRSDQGEDVAWLNAQLAKLNGVPVSSPAAPFDQETARQLRAFQSAQGLQADGLAGPVTLMQLHRAVGDTASDTEPRLLHGASATADVARK